MVIALFGPIALGAVLGVLFACLLGIWLPAGLDGSFLEPLAAQLSRFATLVLALVLVGTGVATMWSLYRLRRWEIGKEPCCFQCGGMVRDLNGRYGPYQHCLNCGANRKI